MAPGKKSLHPIEYLLDDPSVTEIMVNSYNKIFVERNGCLEETSVCFSTADEYYNYILDLLRKDQKDPGKESFFDGSLGQDCRYNIVLPPMNPKGPSLTIRKSSHQLLNLDSLLVSGTISEKAHAFFKKIVLSKMNIVISGGTGTGKTTFLQALSSEIPSTERVITIEDVQELKLHQKNWVQLLAVKNNLGRITVKDCLINSLRMRPDRIIVGECRRDETFEMLQAMNTGHEGSMTTVHANNSADCLTRLENLLQSSGQDIGVSYLRRQIANSIDFIIQLGRAPSGKRTVIEIVDINGFQSENITRSTIFKLNTQGALVPSGLVPYKIQRIQERAGVLPLDFFNPDSPYKRVS